MFRTGIWTVEQFWEAQKHPSRKSRSVSLRLLDVADSAGPEDIGIFEAISRVFRTSNGTYRTTYPSRFKDLDAAVLIHLKQLFEQDSAFAIQDRAASNCLTSAEWANSLFPFFTNVRFTASDLLLYLLKAELPSGETFILEPGGEPLQFVAPPFVLPLSGGESRWHVLNRLLIMRALSRLKGLRIGEEDTWEPVSFEPWEIGRIPCTHPRARSLATLDSRFQIASGSVFDGTPDVCQVLRTMNIFNRSYFPEERIKEGIRASLSSLTGNGVWIVGRTIEESHLRTEATIFQKRDGAFELLDRFVHAPRKAKFNAV